MKVHSIRSSPCESDTLDNHRSVVSSSETVFPRFAIRWAVVPSLRVFHRGKLDNYNSLDLWTFEHLLMSIGREDFHRVARHGRGRLGRISVELGTIVGGLTYENGIGSHRNLLGLADRI